MKLIVSFVFFLLALFFFPGLGIAEDMPPLPVLKQQHGLNQGAKHNAAKVRRTENDFFNSDKPLEPVDLSTLESVERVRVKKVVRTVKRTKRNEVKKNSTKKVVRHKNKKVPVKTAAKGGKSKKEVAGNEKPEPKDPRISYLVLPIPDPPLTKWSSSEIETAEKACEAVLSNTVFSYKKIKPMRLGRCGTPAPVKLAKLGTTKNAPIIKPAATMNCKMAAVVADWATGKLQRLAAKFLKTSIKRIHNVASYSCRNRYNASNKKLSEHALANAFDIAGFTTAKGEFISVLDHWELEDRRGQFLRAVHGSACEDFVVVLGPNANEAHKNHFHFDLGRYPICE